MRDTRSAGAANMMTVLLMAFAMSSMAAPPAVESKTRPGQQTEIQEELQALLAKVDAAQLELQNGQPAAFKAL